MMGGPLKLSTHGRGTAPKLPGNGSDASSSVEQVRDGDSFRFREKARGDDRGFDREIGG